MANLRVDKITSTETFETTGSVQFDGANDGLTISDNADFDLGTGDFTIEGWYYLVNAGTYVSLFDFRGSGADGVYPSLLRNNTGDYIYYYVDSASRITNVTINYNTWFHVTVCRSSGITRLFIDGKEKGSFQDSFDYVSRDILLGLSNSNSNDLRGNISNYRVVKGRALYTSNFKPPMRELEVVPGTIVLACQSKTDATLEKTGKTITANGNAVACELTPGILTPVPKAGGGSAITGSVEFDGTEGYLSVPNTEDLRLADSDFTVEAYINFSNGATSNGVIVALWDNTNNQRSWNFYFDRSANELYFAGSTNGSSGNNNVNASIDIEDGEWYHVAACRSGSTIKLFVNGVERASNTSVGTYFDNTTDLVTIGAQNHDNNTFHWKGFISNLRIVKGTALYTDDFIPSTRELKKVPNTVLLCCQDPDSPLTEATGKTITGHGDLYELDENVDLSTTASWVDGSTGAGSASESNGELTMQGNDASNRGIISKTVTEGIRPGVTYQMSFEVFDAATNGKTGLDSNDGTDDVLDDPTATLDMVHFSGGSLDGNTGIFTVEGTATTYQVVMYFQEFGAAGTTEFKVRNITLRAVNAGSTNINKASNFTPQVGDDRKVTFEGVTKVNSDAYFYLPTGDTITRDSRSGRGLFFGGYAPNPASLRNIIDYVTISSQGNAQDFGDLLSTNNGEGGNCASSTRALAGGGQSNTVDITFVTISTTSNATDFGDLITGRRSLAGASSSTRGVFAGGTTPNMKNEIEYVTIASTGDALDFGNLTVARRNLAPAGSPTRGVFAGGNPGSSPNLDDTIDYITFASTGDAVDFGNLSQALRELGGTSSSTRALFAGSYISPAFLTNIEYITIATTGNAQDFGDLSLARGGTAGLSNKIRGVFGGGSSPTYQNVIDFVEISTTGTAKDFGDLTAPRFFYGAASDSHGGLG